SINNPTCYYYLFISECHLEHRHLHSFPTRRSSDLRLVSAIDVARTSLRRPAGAAAIAARCSAGSSDPCRRCSSTVSGRLANRSRSEEHTSELQSRENLVCRLLLEKKKRKKKDQSSR